MTRPQGVGTACGSSDSRPSTVPTPFALVMSMVSIPVFQTGRAGSNPVQGSTRCRHVTHGFRRHRANGVTAHDGKTNNVRLAVGNPHPVFGGVPKRQRELTVNQRLRLRRFESCRHHETQRFPSCHKIRRLLSKFGARPAAVSGQLDGWRSPVERACLENR